MAGSTGRAAIVLVVEDDDDLRGTLVDILTDAGYIVYAARDGGEAMRVLQDVRPALIITDLMMPGKTGWDLLDEVDAHPTLSGTPRIIITAAGNSAWADRRVPVFIKPVRKADLMRAVHSYVGRRRPQAPLAGPGRPPEQ